MSTLQVNTINESTSTSGVTIDGVLIKDGLVDGKDVSALTGAGLVHIDTTTFSSVSSFAKSSVFSASHDIYRIFMTLSASDTANAQAWLQLSASGTALETNYVGKRVYDHLTNTSLKDWLSFKLPYSTVLSDIQQGNALVLLHKLSRTNFPVPEARKNKTSISVDFGRFFTFATFSEPLNEAPT